MIFVLGPLATTWPLIKTIHGAFYGSECELQNKPWLIHEWLDLVKLESFFQEQDLGVPFFNSTVEILKAFSVKVTLRKANISFTLFLLFQAAMDNVMKEIT